MRSVSSVAGDAPAHYSYGIAIAVASDVVPSGREGTHVPLVAAVQYKKEAIEHVYTHQVRMAT